MKSTLITVKDIVTGNNLVIRVWGQDMATCKICNGWEYGMIPRYCNPDSMYGEKQGAIECEHAPKHKYGETNCDGHMCRTYCPSCNQHLQGTVSDKHMTILLDKKA